MRQSELAVTSIIALAKAWSWHAPPAHADRIADSAAHQQPTEQPEHRCQQPLVMKVDGGAVILLVLGKRVGVRVVMAVIVAPAVRNCIIVQKTSRT